MKNTFWALLLIVSSFAVAQTAPAGKKPQSKPGTAAPAAPAKPQTAAPAPAGDNKALSPEAAVITIDGFCKTKPANAAECKTVVTRAEFDKLMEALTAGRPGQQISPQAKRQLGLQYARLLLFAFDAEKRGLDNTPEGQELLRFARLQALAQSLTRSLQEKAQPTPEEIQKYYNDNRSRFTELTLERIMVPIKPTGEGKTNEAEMKQLADQLRERAGGGADFKALQAEAFTKAGMQNPPETRMVVQPEAIPENQRAILQLKVGEVTPVIADPTGFYIYRLEGQNQVPLDKLKDELKNTLAQQKIQQEVDNILKSATPNLNPDYFGAAPPVQSGIGVLPVPGATGGQKPPSAPPAKTPPRQP